MEKGRLKIYFGYSAGVGKTYNMLKDAQIEKIKGLDIVIGYLEPHDRIDTMNMAKGLEQVPLANVTYKGISLKELNVDGVIKRKPKVCLVDELAHTNAPGSKSTKRWIDVEEILNNGIDVWATVNVQHIEGLHDLVDNSTTVDVKEKIPDKVFDSADEVKLIDIEPEDLIERMREGKIYKKTQATYALNNFFKESNLQFLREAFMRRNADRIEKKSNEYTEKASILVLISPSPSSFKNIYIAARMAQAYHASFCAMYVERNFELDNDSASNLKQHMRLVKDLGGDIVVKYSDDVLSTIVNYAKISGVTDLVMGKNWKTVGSKVGLEDKVIEQLPNIQVLIVPDSEHVEINTYKFKSFIRTIKTKLSYKCKYRYLNKLIDIYSILSLKAISTDDTLQAITETLSNAFDRSVALITSKVESLTVNNSDLHFFKEQNELAVAEWVRKNKEPAGRGTNTLRSSKAIYMPLKSSNENYALAISCVNGKLKISDRMVLNQLIPFLNVVLSIEKKQSTK